MAKQRNKRSGGKYAGSHTTFIDGTGDVLDFIAEQRRVHKIVLGKIDMLNRHSSCGLHIKCTNLGSETGGNCCINVRIAFGCGAQDIYVYIVHPAVRRNFCKVLKRFVARRAA